jgi:hypothetical protein
MSESTNWLKPLKALSDAFLYNERVVSESSCNSGEALEGPRLRSNVFVPLRGL